MFALLIATMGFVTGNDVLIDTATLEKTLATTTIVDCRTAEAFAAGHVPGATNLDAATMSETRDGVKGMLKPVDVVTGMLMEVGIGMDKPVVVYGSMKGTSDLSAVTRMFWILEVMGYQNVSLLDGGIEKWVSEKRAVEEGPTKVAPLSQLVTSFRRELLAEKADVVKAGGEGVLLLDNRSAEQFEGKGKEEYIANAGHIPGAVNLPAGQCVDDSKKTMKSWGELQTIMKNAGGGADQKLITYCNSGRSASIGYFVARSLGYKHVRLYDGSMAEWGNDAALPVESEAAAK